MLRHHILNLKQRILQYQGVDSVNRKNVGVKSKNVGVNLTLNQRKIYDMIKGNPSIAHMTIATTLSITTKTAKRATKTLREYGLIRREGSDKTGKWVIIR